MTAFVAHERLAKAPLAEAVFELRYNTGVPLEAIHAGLQAKLPAFRNEERIEGQVISVRVGPNGAQTVEAQEQDVVRHRFRNPDTDEFFQIGQGIVSVNTVRYDGFKRFMEALEPAVRAHNELAQPSAYRRLSLRYINHLPLEDGPERAFAWLAPIPHTWSSRVTLQNVQQIALRAGEDVQNVTIAYPQTNLQTGANVMILDIDHHLDFVLPVLPDVDQVLGWVSQAHDQVYQTFRSALKDEYFKELQ